MKKIIFIFAILLLVTGCTGSNKSEVRTPEIVALEYANAARDIDVLALNRLRLPSQSYDEKRLSELLPTLIGSNTELDIGVDYFKAMYNDDFQVENVINSANNSATVEIKWTGADVKDLKSKLLIAMVYDPNIGNISEDEYQEYMREKIIEILNNTSEMKEYKANLGLKQEAGQWYIDFESEATFQFHKYFNSIVEKLDN